MIIAKPLPLFQAARRYERPLTRNLETNTNENIAQSKLKVLLSLSNLEQSGLNLVQMAHSTTAAGQSSCNK